jgi:hypothetical protein
VAGANLAALPPAVHPDLRRLDTPWPGPLSTKPETTASRAASGGESTSMQGPLLEQVERLASSHIDGSGCGGSSGIGGGCGSPNAASAADMAP